MSASSHATGICPFHLPHTRVLALHQVQQRGVVGALHTSQRRHDGVWAAQQQQQQQQQQRRVQLPTVQRSMPVGQWVQEQARGAPDAGCQVRGGTSSPGLRVTYIQPSIT